MGLGDTHERHLRPQDPVEGTGQRDRIHVGMLKRNDLVAGMDSGIRPSGDRGHDPGAKDGFEGLIQLALDCSQANLARITPVSGAVI